MGIHRDTTHIISGDWKLKGPRPTVQELIDIGNELRNAGIPPGTEVHYEPPYSDIQVYPARLFIKPFEVKS